jgi:formylglycine-generating enzyme required for sulfatase activity
MADTPVTQAMYTAVMGQNPSRFTPPNSELRPVEEVSWLDAVELTHRLQRFMQSLFSSIEGDVFRLPTEAEWEYACRAVSTGATYASVGLKLMDIAWVSRDDSGSTQPVAQLKPNAWGLFDTLGNVWEWCADACDWDQPYPGGPRVDPLGVEGPGRAQRGGSFIRGGDSPRAAMRHADPPDYRSYTVGLRICIGPPLARQPYATRSA